MKLLELEKMEIENIIDSFSFPHDEVIAIRQESLKNFKSLGLPKAKNELF